MAQAIIAPSADSITTMTSREIAHLVGKEHKHVMRDIRTLKEQLGDMFVGSVQNWAHPQNGQEYQEFLLDKNTSLILALGYDFADQMRVVRRWQEIEANAAQPACHRDPVMPAKRDTTMTNTPKATDLLNKAASHMADRAATYDKPEGERSMGRAVQAFNAITGRDLSETEGWLLMQVLKDVRLFQRAGYHADSAEDCIAYAALKAEAKAREGVAVAVSKKVTDESGWIKWSGGECPVPRNTRVAYRTICHDHPMFAEDLANALSWTHSGGIGDIIAYRVISETSKPDYTSHELYGRCSDCKHCYEDPTVDPCKSCLASEEGLPNWEPAEDKE